MRVVLAAALAALGLAGCLQQTNEGTAEVTACNATASDTWVVTNSVAFGVEANAFGPSCERAVATLVIRDSEGLVAWVEAFPTENVMVLKDARDVTAMETALAEWIAPESNSMLQSTAALPDWPAGADAPQSGEFPFYPEESHDRESYSALRANNYPMYCFVQGAESMACVAYGDGGIERVGVQTFPG